MPYFFILPAFVLVEAVLLMMLAASFAAPGLNRYQSKIIGVLVWGTLGFVLGNILVIGLMVGAFWAVERTEAGDWVVLQLMLGALVFIGPFVGSFAGGGIGTLIGMKRRSRGQTGSA
jgi:hypothetical protein